MALRYFAIILRVRFDALDSGQSTERVVHGSVQLVGAKQMHYFSSFDEILEILKRTASWQDPPPTESSGKEHSS